MVIDIPGNQLIYPTIPLEELFEGCPVRRCKKNEVLITPDDQPTFDIYYIRSGELKVYTIMPSGEKRTWYYLFPGRLAGTAFSFSRMKTMHFCEATKPSELLICNAKVFWQKLQERDLAYDFLCNEEAKAMQFMDLVISAKYNLKSAIKQLLELGYTHQEIADFLGYSRVQISRICSKIYLSETN